MKVQGFCRVEIAESAEERARSPLNKPFVRLIFPQADPPVTVEISTNLGEMIGAASAGLRQREEMRGDGKAH